MNLTFLSSKGGVGKTTLALSTITLLSEASKPITGLDCDDQQGLALWHRNSLKNNTALPNVHIHAAVEAADLKARVAEAARLGHHIIFDTKGARSPVAIDACGYSDAVLVPFMVDIQSVERSAEIALRIMPEIRKAKNRDIPCFLVLNNVNMMDSNVKSTPRLIEHLRSLNIQILDAQVKQRPVYKAIQNFACGFDRVGGTSAPAARSEIYEMLKEVSERVANAKEVAA